SKLASEATGDGIAGNIDITTNQLRISDNSQANVSSKDNGSAGSVFVRASDVFLNNQSQIAATTEQSGTDGNITLENLNSLELFDSRITASTINGEAGNININAADSVKLESGSKLTSEARGSGEAGELIITTNQFTMTNSQVNVSSKADGIAGDVFINASDVNMNQNAKIFATTESGVGDGIALNGLTTLSLNNSEISASTIDGVAGDIDINATNSVKLENGSKIASEATGNGEAGDITTTTNQFAAADNSQATVSSKGRGNAGFMLIEASNVFLDNQAKISGTTESGIGGNITLDDLTSLSLNNSEISASTEDGVAGTLNINAADSIELTGKGGFSVQSTEGGTAGSVIVNTSQFNINDEAQVTVSSRLGQAGNLEIIADDLFLNRGRLTAETGVGESSEGANITLDIQDLLWMRNGSLISAEAFDTANGGNITINNAEGFTIGLRFENSDISANATQGNGGNIDITTQNIFGLVFRDRKTSYSDITASSKFGVSGEVTVNQLNVNPDSGLIELPSNLVGTTKIEAGCAASAGNNFVISGRGGLPESPDDLFTGNTAIIELVDLVLPESVASKIKNENSYLSVDNQENQIVEATEWEIDADGNVIFVAQVSESNPQHSGLSSLSCENFNDNK
ncbi:MAG: S-layer family protein, partial [Cyanobacteria bacterium P01_D01_bin.50]